MAKNQTTGTTGGSTTISSGGVSVTEVLEEITRNMPEGAIPIVRGGKLIDSKAKIHHEKGDLAVLGQMEAGEGHVKLGDAFTLYDSHQGVGYKLANGKNALGVLVEYDENGSGVPYYWKLNHLLVINGCTTRGVTFDTFEYTHPLTTNIHLDHINIIPITTGELRVVIFEDDINGLVLVDQYMTITSSLLNEVLKVPFTNPQTLDIGQVIHFRLGGVQLDGGIAGVDDAFSGANAIYLTTGRHECNKVYLPLSVDVNEHLKHIRYTDPTWTVGMADNHGLFFKPEYTSLTSPIKDGNTEPLGHLEIDADGCTTININDVLPSVEINNKGVFLQDVKASILSYVSLRESVFTAEANGVHLKRQGRHLVKSLGNRVTFSNTAVETANRAALDMHSDGRILIESSGVHVTANTNTVLTSLDGSTSLSNAIGNGDDYSSIKLCNTGDIDFKYNNVYYHFAKGANIGVFTEESTGLHIDTIDQDVFIKRKNVNALTVVDDFTTLSNSPLTGVNRSYLTLFQSGDISLKHKGDSFIHANDSVFYMANLRGSGYFVDTNAGKDSVNIRYKDSPVLLADESGLYLSKKVSGIGRGLETVLISDSNVTDLYGSQARSSDGAISDTKILRSTLDTVTFYGRQETDNLIYKMLHSINGSTLLAAAPLPNNTTTSAIVLNADGTIDVHSGNYVYELTKVLSDIALEDVFAVHKSGRGVLDDEYAAVLDGDHEYSAFLGANGKSTYEALYTKAGVTTLQGKGVTVDRAVMILGDDGTILMRAGLKTISFAELLNVVENFTVGGSTGVADGVVTGMNLVGQTLSLTRSNEMSTLNIELPTPTVNTDTNNFIEMAWLAGTMLTLSGAGLTDIVVDLGNLRGGGGGGDDVSLVSPNTLNELILDDNTVGLKKGNRTISFDEIAAKLDEAAAGASTGSAGVGLANTNNTADMFGKLLSGDSSGMYGMYVRTVDVELRVAGDALVKLNASNIQIKAAAYDGGSPETVIYSNKDFTFIYGKKPASENKAAAPMLSSYNDIVTLSNWDKSTAIVFEANGDMHFTEHGNTFSFAQLKAVTDAPAITEMEYANQTLTMRREGASDLTAIISDTGYGFVTADFRHRFGQNILSNTHFTGLSVSTSSVYLQAANTLLITATENATALGSKTDAGDVFNLIESNADGDVAVSGGGLGAHFAEMNISSLGKITFTQGSVVTTLDTLLETVTFSSINTDLIPATTSQRQLGSQPALWAALHSVSVNTRYIRNNLPTQDVVMDINISATVFYSAIEPSVDNVKWLGSTDKRWARVNSVIVQTSELQDDFGSTVANFTTQTQVLFYQTLVCNSAKSLGTALKRWGTFYTVAVNNVSDRRLKNSIGLDDGNEYGYPSEWLDAWNLVQWTRYKLNNKGDDARWDGGIIAQDIIAAFNSINVDALNDTEFVFEDDVSNEDEDEQLQLSVNYNVIQSIENAYQRRRMDRIEVKLAILGV